MQLEMNFSPGDVAQQNLLADRAAGLKKKFKITFSNSEATTATFEAFVMGFSVAGGVDALTTATVTLEISGAVVWVYDPTP